MKTIKEPKARRFRGIIEMHVNQLTDVFIVMISSVHSECRKDSE
jgi:hypothetical protein